MKLKTTLILPLILSSTGCMLKNDPPRCDSEEVKSIVEKLVANSLINGNGCVEKQSYLHSVTPVANASECPVGTYKSSLFPQEARIVTFGDDFKSSFTSYIIKSENIAQDGLSVSCSFGLETHTTSKKTNYDQPTKYKPLQLKVFKKGENGDIPYEFLWESN